MKVVTLFNNEAKLIKKAAAQNRKAQHTLFEMHAPKMLSVCRYYIKDLQKAEEVMLNGFLKVFTHLNQFKSLGSFEGWIRRIMVRECISFLRQEKQIYFTEETHPFTEIEDSTTQQYDVAHLQHMIDQLPSGYKMVFIMYAIEGYKHSEIAKELNITEGTSKSQLFKARQLLQQQINALNKTEYGSK
ncbi:MULTISPECIES: RNA polymerase sigma factor [Mesoflavibacter]|uniref:RNA polymerase sigma factor n=1 Tax=Mesoflavibacter profundi TaxID=2708110 RepID=A0ABT4S001_9FLAO|nr:MULTISPECIES: RNA polymerase sigma factor [Mesoflavibacter]MDA0177414.1 RNA polymerase sigma factor [Mesoflavibacter profundi]QIJ88368.1 RNA polymerase ECF-type sigma factor [Mesoflavibacter sp. HG96]QIJ91096.1 RNA polymerase ECF-type sigma factor [Mesoflavibacter sp. HG37]